MVGVRGALNVGPAGKGMGVVEEERGQCAMRRSGAEERNRVAVGPEGGKGQQLWPLLMKEKSDHASYVCQLASYPLGHLKDNSGSGHDSASPLCVICFQAWLVSDRTDLIYNYYEACTEFKQTTLGKYC